MIYQAAFEQLGISTNFYILPSRGNDQEGYLAYTEYLQKDEWFDRYFGIVARRSKWCDFTNI